MMKTKSKDKIKLFALVAAAILLSASSAASQECATDADCGDGEYCQLDPLFEMCQNPEPEQEWACEGPELEPLGRCLLIDQRCETDDDCAEYFACLKEGSAMIEGCAAPAEPGADAPPCTSRSIEYESKYGNCEPGPIDCETDSDCPAPLTCVEFASPGLCWASSDGESGCDEGTVEKRCEFEPPSCETDDDCEAGSECVEAGTSNVCDTASAGTSRAAPPPADPGASEDVPIAPPCAEGDEACTSGSGGAGSDVPPDIEPEPVSIMPVCETTIEKICFPKRVDCTDDEQCAAGETCTDFSEMYSSPSWWEDGEEAIACMPEGLAMAFQGHTTQGVAESDEIAVDATVGRDSMPTSTNQAGTGEGGDVAEEDETIGTGNGNESEANDESQESSDGGCSIARASGNASSSWLLLIASVFILRSIRRRRS